MKQNRYPSGWNEERVRKLLLHYEAQTGDEAVAEDEAAFQQKDQTVMIVPKKLVMTITRLIARERSLGRSLSRRSSRSLHPPARKTRRG